MLLHHFGFFEREIIYFFLILSHRVEIFPIILSLKFHVKFWFHIKSAAQDNFSNFHTVFFLSFFFANFIFFKLVFSTFFKHIFVLCFVWIFFWEERNSVFLVTFLHFFQPNIAHQIVFLYTFISFKFLRDIQITTSHSARALFSIFFQVRL